MRSLTQVFRRGQAAEIQWAGETLWVGEMNLDLPPTKMVPEMLERASSELWPSGKQKLDSLRGGTHPNDFTGYPTTPGKVETWRMVIDVKKKFPFNL